MSIESRESASYGQSAYGDGKSMGLALGALAASAVAFVSLLGIEKAGLALVLAVLAIRGTWSGSRARRLAIASIAVACIYAVTYILVIFVYHDKLAELLRLMQRLG
jgi:hypothetical protein